MKTKVFVVLMLCFSLLTGCKDKSVQEKTEDRVKTFACEEEVKLDGFETLKVTIDQTDECGGGHFILKYGNSKQELVDYCEFSPDSYLIYNDHEFYGFILAGYANDYKETYFIYCQKGDQQPTIIKKYEAEVMKDDLSKEHIRLDSRFNLFGTFSAYRTYSIKNNQLVLNDSLYYFHHVTNLTLIKDLPCYIDGKKSSIPSGEKIRFTKTDGKAKIYFKSGKIKGYFKFKTAKDYSTHTIEGIEEDKYFKYLPYAG